MWLSINTNITNILWHHSDFYLRQVLERLKPLSAELNYIFHLLELLEAHHILHVSGLGVKPKFVSIFCGSPIFSSPTSAYTHEEIAPGTYWIGSVWAHVWICGEENFSSGQTGAGTNWIGGCVSQFRSGRVAKSKILYVGGNRRWYLSEKRLCVSQFRSGRMTKRKLGASGYPVNSLVTILKQVLTPPS
jgi:hypothetical protein